MAIRILHYLRNLGLGGTEKTCQLFFEHASEDFEVILVHEATGDKTRLEEFQKGAAVSRGTIIEIDSYYGNPQGTPDGRPLQEVIDAVKPDIVHVYRSGYAEFPEPGQDINVPHFVETNVFGFLDANPKIDRTLFMSRWLQKFSLERANVPANHAIMKRMDFVNNPVESPYTDDTLSGLSSDAIWLGRCGRPDNGIYHAISVEAARLLRLEGIDVRFLVVAPPSNMIQDLARYEIPFKMIEPTTNPLILSQFYNSVDIYAHARADGETFGVNIAEAMMHGKPTVTHIAEPSVPGMGVFQSQTELVSDTKTGYIVRNDPASYANALRRLCKSPELREAMGTTALAKATSEYHVDACMQKLENIYREVVNE